MSSNPSPTSLLELLAVMVREPSVVPCHSGDPQSELALARRLQRIASDWGLATRWLEVSGAAPNLLVTPPAATGAGPWLVFDSHLDTVGTESMTIPPFAAEIRDERLWGRGACDTKASGAAMLWSLAQVARDYPAAPVAVVFTVGEEHIQRGARAMADRCFADLGWQVQGVIVGEPTSLDVVAASGGFLRWNLETLGKAVHSTRPTEGRNAISDMLRLLTTIEAEYLPQLTATHPLTGQAVASITMLSGGRQMNIIPDHCTATIDRRLVPGETLTEERARFEGIVARVADATPGMLVRVSRPEGADPLNPASLDFAEACLATVRRDVPVAALTGALYTSNANFYSAAGLATVVLGPGDIAQAHTADEWVAVEQVELAALVYRRAMLLHAAG